MADPLTLGLMAASTALSAVSSIGGGIAAGKAAKIEAREMERQAIARQAEGSHRAAEEHRQKRLALSRAMAVGAASGAGRDFQLEGEIEGEGEYRGLLAMFEGENEAQSLRRSAQIRRAEGSAARRAGFIGAFGELVGGAANFAGSKPGRSFLKKYGG